jgi:hypothetical protein
MSTRGPTEVLATRVRPEIRKVFEQTAKRDRCTVANVVRKLAEDFAEGRVVVNPSRQPEAIA